MSARRRTRLIAPLAALLLAGGLAACGDDAGSADPTGVSDGGGLDQLEIEGEVGSEPELTWNDAVTVEETEFETVVEGDGEQIEAGDAVVAHITVANGVSEQVTSSDYSTAPQVVTLGDQVVSSIRDALVGQTVGSRVAVAATPQDSFGENGNPQLGIGNEDTVVFILDAMEKLDTEPSGTEKNAPPWVPEIVEENGVPSSLDFAGTPEPRDRLRVATLVEGDGAAVESGQQVYVNYLGQVYGADEPFDGSFESGQLFPFQIGAGQVVQGWDQGLEGVTVGSRVVLSIPPGLGYGEQGNEQAGISGTDTLYFVVDVLAAF